jgi:Ser/Thr protein kinase RdoA (MazF antagonist)
MDLGPRLTRVLGVAEVRELVGGHQSRVFRMVGPNGTPAVAKVLDASMVNRVELDARLDVTAALAELDPRVCRPLPISGQLVTELVVAEAQLRYVICFELADGIPPDPARAADAERMGRTLAELHSTMRRLHRPGWKAKLHPDASLEVTGPDGATRVTRPPGQLELSTRPPPTG